MTKVKAEEPEIPMATIKQEIMHGRVARGLQEIPNNSKSSSHNGT